MADELKDSKIELEKANARLAELEKANAKLKEEKAATFEIIESEKARLLAEYKEKKDKAVDQAMYRIWASNANLDTSFLGSFEEGFVAKWQARLDAEEATRAAWETAQKDSHTIRPGESSAPGDEKAKETAPS
ncbi:uncharacterized protein LOC133828076 [Humulus lupulus]|uniref:uncharacterized protein LOC133828076 n=1 Tax=Humulus lupulus TaxID=3486 RepID=UPI002B41183A|nr:uncharacterized protein LOC133828076 [Humulus lupulus]